MSGGNLFSQYQAISTGGGFVAYFRKEQEVEVLLTCADNEARLPNQDDKIDVGFYDAKTGEWLQNESTTDKGRGLTLTEAESYIRSFLKGKA